MSMHGKGSPSGRRLRAPVAAVLLVVGASSSAWAASDAWITTKAKMQLLTTENVGGLDIRVDTIDGKVTLQGPVGTAEEQARAVQAVRTVDGVREVRDLLEVVPERQAKVVAAKDDIVRADVQAALEKSSRLADGSIEVRSVTNGVVVLGGTAATLGDHEAALLVARGVAGVKRVESQIESPDQLGDADLANPQASASDEAAATGKAAAQYVEDGWITAKAKVRLIGTADVASNDVNVDSRDGVVTLFGTVPSEAGRAAAVAAVTKLDGVREVKDQLQIVSEATEKAVERSDDSIESAVKARLADRDDLGADHIDVDLAKGIAKLTGTVRSQDERLTALVQTRAVVGVRSVIDELTIVHD